LHKRRSGHRLGQNLQESIDLIIEHLDRHDDTLWGHIIELSDGRVRVLNRTNIASESNFNVMKHNERRRSGRKNLGQDLENMQAAAALTRNLKKDDYVQIVCGGDIKRLPKAIAELDIQVSVHRTPKLETGNSKFGKKAPTVAIHFIPRKSI
jgi:hypothetical protein